MSPLGLTYISPAFVLFCKCHKMPGYASFGLQEKHGGTSVNEISRSETFWSSRVPELYPACTWDVCSCKYLCPFASLSYLALTAIYPISIGIRSKSVPGASSNLSNHLMSSRW